MKTFAGIVVIVCIVMAILYGSSQIDNPFGATTRVEIEQREETNRTRIEADAQRYEAEHGTIQAGIWAGMLPTGAVIIVIGSALLLVIWYRGKAHLIQVERGYLPRMDTPPNCSFVPPPTGVSLLAMHLGAQERLVNGQWALYKKDAMLGWAMPVNGQWALVDNHRQVMAVLEDRYNGSHR